MMQGWSKGLMLHRSVRLLLVGLTAVLAHLAATATADTPRPVEAKSEATFTRDIQPLLAKYCYTCHGGAKPKSGLALDKHRDESFIVKHRDVWDLVVQNLRSGTMPPEGKPKPSPRELEQLAGWVERKLAAIDCTKNRDVGRVTIRRLNRAEYNNTIRDLVGVNFQPADDFPADDVGYGFDNIGDVLAMPPLLLEKYLNAAEKIIAAALTTHRERAVVQQFKGKGLTATIQGADRQEEMRLHSNGEVFVLTNLPKSGEYVVRVRAYGQQAGKEPVRMALRVDGRELQVLDVPAVEGKPKTYEFRHRLPAGQRRVAAAFVNDYYQPNDPDPANRDRNLVVLWMEIEGPVDAVAVGPSESYRRIMIVQPGPELSEDEAARRIIENFARRAYRRPVKAEEVQRLLRFVTLARQNGEPFEQAIQLPLKAILVSPHFLYRVELDRPPVRPDGAYYLSDHELASRLSYFLWSSMPDDELFRAAELGTLRKPENLEAQVRRMLKDPKAQALVENFAGQWLQTRSVRTFQPDPELFPEFDEALRTAMIKETELFFETIMREDRTILEFLDADYTFVNERLARHYGIPNVRGSQFRKVTLSGDQRGGLLTQASILMVTSNPTRTSPVKRGKWILENILNTPPPPPPPDAGELKEDKETVLSGSLRQRMEQHRANPTCASCHQRMDPLGFGFENYNAIGAWRTQDGKFTIDPSGTLPTGQSFKSPKELKQILLGKDEQFRKCLTDRLLTYALGRGLETSDRCVVDDIAAAVVKDQNRFGSLVLNIVKSEPFQMRRGPKGAK